MSTENESIEPLSGSSESDIPAKANGLLSFLRFILGWYVFVFTGSVLFWLVRLPFYDDSILEFLWGALIYASLSLAIVGICFFIFLAGIKYKLLGYALLTLIVLGALSRCGSESDGVSCVETRYFSTCE